MSASSTATAPSAPPPSFSAWFQEAEKNAKSGKDPLASTVSSGSAASSASDYLQGWMKSWTQSDEAQKQDDLEAGGLLSRSSTVLESGGDEYTLTRTERFK